jgi:hypothetical protein
VADLEAPPRRRHEVERNRCTLHESAFFRCRFAGCTVVGMATSGADPGFTPTSSYIYSELM